MKVHELASEMGVKAGVILKLAKKLGFRQDHHMDDLSESRAEAIRQGLSKPSGSQPAGECLEVDETLPEVKLPPGHVAGPDGLEVPAGSKIAEPARMVDVNYQGKVRSVRV